MRLFLPFFCAALLPAFAADAPDLAALALQNLNAARYEEAAANYQQLIAARPSDPAFYYYRVRALIASKHSKDAFETADLALKNVPNTAFAHAAAGLADIRRGDLSGAETHFKTALTITPDSPQAISGLARIYSIASLSLKAQNFARAAWERNPNDTAFARSRANTLDGAPHLEALENLLPVLDPASEDARSLRVHIASDRALGDRKVSRLVSPYVSTRVKLIRIMDGPRNPRGVGLDVRLNNKTTVKLLLDTGASGISISPRLAEKAGLQPLVPETSLTRGIGDAAPQTSQTYLAPEVRVGSVVFTDVPIDAFTSATSSDIDGLIGADVFQRFLVSIDFAGFELQLEPRPGETAEEPLQPSNAVTPHAPGFHGVFRFGPHMVIPTAINRKSVVLFLIDSGATNNLIDTTVAREFTRVSKDPQTTVRGVQGKVDQVSRADRVTLNFAGFQQDNADLVAFSLEKMSDSLGTKISGVLGMPVLERMRMTLDYKEGTVRFEYRH